MKARAKSRKAKPTAASDEWDLRPYVAGPTAKSNSARKNVKTLCEQQLPGRYHLEVIDLMKTPKPAQGDQILAIPSLVRKLPAPIRKVVGDLSNTAQVLVGLDLRPHQANPYVTMRNEGNRA